MPDEEVVLTDCELEWLAETARAFGLAIDEVAEEIIRANLVPERPPE